MTPHLLQLAELHAANLKADIANAASRQEDMRLRRLTIEAEALADQIRLALEPQQGQASPPPSLF